MIRTWCESAWSLKIMSPETNYTSPAQSNNKRRLAIIGGAVFLVILVIIAVSSFFLNRGTNPQNTSLRQFNGSNVTIQYPAGFETAFTNDKLTFEFNGEDVTKDFQKLTVSQYLRTETLSEGISEIKELSTKNAAGNIVAQSKEVQINGKPALRVEDSGENFAPGEKMFVMGDEYVWLIEARYSSSNTLLAKNLDKIFESFSIKSEASAN